MLVFAVSFCFSAIKLLIIYLYFYLCLKSLTLCDLHNIVPRDFRHLHLVSELSWPRPPCLYFAKATFPSVKQIAGPCRSTLTLVSVTAHCVKL